ncbi:hypothetical protein Q6D67_05125 [Haliea sp. E1-2-M8]|uniref:hypothetical protein n=1 Tax=Haliea sp. E1-2-M8 TaxID=3064706 RepID=UPI0027220F2E|nr:hypothetical protein [Haliea sp. E1-2-M8]MDO8861079.1 hypothetical protein [Haliea sp. E1-2-M8]
MERASWLGLSILGVFVVAATVCDPTLISKNQFMIQLVTPDIISIAIVMLTVSLPVAYQIMRLINEDKKKIRGSDEFTSQDKNVICSSLDNVIEKVKANSTLMVIYFFGILVVTFMIGFPFSEGERIISILMGFALYLLCHMTLFMVELYVALSNWRDAEDIFNEAA